jgi:uncharacterized membrane protein YcaP (DUF421 family)
MGKRQIGEMQPFELVITLLIAELACIPMADLSVPLGYGIIAIVALFLLHQFLSVIEKKSRFIGKLISSKPSIVINSDGINFQELKKLNISVNELQESLRNAGYSSFDEAEYALIETNGKFSVLPRRPDENAAPEEKTPLPICLIEDGKFKIWEMNRLSLQENEVMAAIRENGIRDLKDVAVATYDNNGKLYFQKAGEKYKVVRKKFEGAAEW